MRRRVAQPEADDARSCVQLLSRHRCGVPGPYEHARCERRRVVALPKAPSTSVECVQVMTARDVVIRDQNG